MAKPYIGLYYPYIHFKDDNWVKLNTFYWDHLVRIVPVNYVTANDSRVVKELQEKGFIVNDKPSKEAVESKKLNDFLSWIRDHEKQLIDLYTIKSKNRNQSFTPAYIHNDKIAHAFKYDLVQMGLAIDNRGNDQHWIGMHPKIAEAYMSILAEAMAGKASYPVTDDATSFIAVGGWTTERIAHALLSKNSYSRVKIDETQTKTKKTETQHGEDAREVESQLVTIAVKSVIPKGLDDIPISKILSIRTKYKDELLAFRNALEELSVEIQPLLEDNTSLRIRQMVLEDAFKNTIEPKLTEVKKTISFEGIDVAETALLFALPALAATNAPLAVTATTSLVLGVHQIFKRKRHEIGKDAANSAGAYLMRVQEDLQPANLTRKVVTPKIRKFMLGY